jgi:hypothetical protein
LFPNKPTPSPRSTTGLASRKGRPPPPPTESIGRLGLPDNSRSPRRCICCRAQASQSGSPSCLCAFAGEGVPPATPRPRRPCLAASASATQVPPVPGKPRQRERPTGCAALASSQRRGTGRDGQDLALLRRHRPAGRLLEHPQCGPPSTRITISREAMDDDGPLLASRGEPSWPQVWISRCAALLLRGARGRVRRLNACAVIARAGD